MNRALLQRLADVLQVEGVKQMPAFLNQDQIVVTISLDAFLNGGAGPIPTALPNAGYGALLSMEDALSVDGDSEIELAIVGQNSGTVQNYFPRAADLAYQFGSIWVKLTFDAAGAIAFNGQDLSLQLKLWDGGDPGILMPLIDLSPWTRVVTGTLDYIWCINLSSNRNAASAFQAFSSAGVWGGGMECNGGTLYRGAGLTQPMGLLGLDIEINFDGNLPANTTVEIKAIARQATNGIVPVRF